MAQQNTRGKSRPRSGTGSEIDWKRSVSAGATVAAVVVTLLLGWGLRAGTEPDPTLLTLSPETEPAALAEDSADSRESAEKPLERPDPLPPTPAPRAKVGPKTMPGGDLARRSADDRRRLLDSGAGWTLQFLYSCEPKTIRSLVHSLGGAESLYVLATEDCYRVCWGAFASRERAVSAGGIPAALARLGDDPFPRQVAETLR